ncbi:MAG: hypothetical protein M1832_004823 [Thelocarpon impressellum]|nr:MAG: hypothetical protein M1832_004823 [Thelocarpon impressellum]
MPSSVHPGDVNPRLGLLLLLLLLPLLSLKRPSQAATEPAPEPPAEPPVEPAEPIAPGPVIASDPAPEVAPAKPAEPAPDAAGFKLGSLEPSGATWTEEVSLLLMQLKDTEGKTWKEVHAELPNFTQKELKQRYRGLKNARNAGGSVMAKAVTEAAAAAAPKKSKQPKQTKQAKKVEESVKRKAATPDPEKEAAVAQDEAAAADNHPPSDDDAPSVNIDPGSDTEPLILEPASSSRGYTLADDEWQKDEVVLLVRLAARYDSHKWLHVASQFYDATGIRVSAEAVRAKIG